jgi:hypothetical protein
MDFVTLDLPDLIGPDYLKMVTLCFVMKGKDLPRYPLGFFFGLAQPVKVA